MLADRKINSCRPRSRASRQLFLQSLQYLERFSSRRNMLFSIIVNFSSTTFKYDGTSNLPGERTLLVGSPKTAMQKPRLHDVEATGPSLGQQLNSVPTYS